MSTLDLDALEGVARAATPGEMYADTNKAARFRGTFDPPTTLGLIARAREADTLRAERDELQALRLADAEVRVYLRSALAEARATIERARDEYVALWCSPGQCCAGYCALGIHDLSRDDMMQVRHALDVVLASPAPSPADGGEPRE